MELISVELHMGARASKIDPVGVVVFVRDLLLVEEMGHLGLACAARGSPKETLFCSEYCTVRFVCRFVVTQSHSAIRVLIALVRASATCDIIDVG